ncbi:VirB3 family type IV secretion system protein [Brevundimonas bacteroides]|uniref:VirB3 family type IV secretion system protein n=1 Tax=Brevundimonas bacteroides TaxID=74311 RepID=UPI0004964F8D|nr:VirB3 family type IV secretion system protein [Brevundimonas bacteroides]
MTGDHRPEGYELAVAQALTRPVLLGGLPRDYAILMGTLALMLGLALRLPWLGLIWWALAHGLGLLAARGDPQVFDVVRRHLARPGHLDT